MINDEKLRRSIHTLDLHPRPLRLVDAKGIRTVGELVVLGRRGCWVMRGFGNSSLSSV